MAHGTETVVGEVFNFGVLHLEWPNVLFIVVVFFTTMFFLNMWLFRPILRTIEARQAKVNKDNDGVKSLSATISASEEEYQAKLADVNEKIRVARQSALAEAKEAAGKILEQVKADSKQVLDAGNKEIAAERQSALDQVASLSEELAQLINAKVLA